MTATAPTPPLPADARGVRHFQFRALGTECAIKFRHPDETIALRFAADALDWIGKFEAKFSRFRPDSIISRINAAAGVDWTPIDPETERMLEIGDGLYRLTDGIMDPSMLPLLRVWDWKTVHERLPDKSVIATARSLTGWEKIQRRPGAILLPHAGMGLDLGGFGKELAVDAVAKIASNAGITDALIDLGRDVFAMGGNGTHPFWHIGIEDGNRTGQCWGGLAISGVAVSASGSYARHFTHHGITYGHILDPRTGWPVSNGMRAVHVIAKTCLEAGIYSTAVYVLGTRKGLDLASRSPGVSVCAQDRHGIGGSRDFDRWLVKAA